MARGRASLSEALILSWADRHRAGTGRWPNRSSGTVLAAPGEVWSNIDAALKQGARGLPGGDTLQRLLARRRRVHSGAVPQLSERLILSWADAHHRATGRWPQAASGRVAASPRETWRAIQEALRQGLRGLPGGDTLARLLVRHRRRKKRWQRG
jgi:hypothetical protein